MNKHSVALSLALMAGISLAHAQTPVAPVQVEPAAEVNPFTGNSTVADVSRKSLDHMKLKTQISEEMVKQRALELELSNLPLKKQAEIAPAQLTLDKLQNDREEQARQKAAREEAARRLKQQELLAKKAASAKKNNDGPQAPVMREPQVNLISVTAIGQSKHAVFEVDGVTVMFEDGQATPLGPLKITGDKTAQLGMRTLKVHSNTLSRMVVTDQIEEAEGSTQASAPVVQAMPGNPLQAQGNSTNLPPPTVPVTPAMLEQMGIPSPQM